MLEYPPPPCPVDDTPYTACCGHDGPYSVDSSGRIHPGKGGVIVIKQLPARDAAEEASSPTAASVVAPVPVAIPPAPPRRARRAR
jgi:hypothetical protein